MRLSLIDKAVLSVAPMAGLRRIEARAAAGRIMAYYDAAGGGRRQGSWHPSRGDADASGGRRQRLSWISRDMIRNNPIATGAVQTIVAHTVGKGIQPRLAGFDDAPGTKANGGGESELLETAKAAMKLHFDSTRVDYRGRETLAGLQRLAMAAVATDGEVLIVQHDQSAGLYPQFEVLEIDHLDSGAWKSHTNGGYVQDGIEYDANGQRVAYHLYEEHPGAQGLITWRAKTLSRRVPAEMVLHLYRQDRPGQERGVTWFAPVALTLQDLADYDDAQLVRQKIAALFTIFRRTDAPGTAPQSLSPGAMVDVSDSESYDFATPPGVEGYDEFTRGQLARIAKGLGLTYEALSGDLRRVNFSSGKMGRLEMDRNVEGWQKFILIDQMLTHIGRAFLRALALENPLQAARIMTATIDWVPPARIMVDPSRELPPMIEAVRAGFTSRQRTQTELGRDPDMIHAEILEDQIRADGDKMIFSSDGRYQAAAAPAVAHTEQTDDVTPERTTA
ncbi:phage portal protein [Shimia ponticola]|uniref:phage portal protein n=1 Tax=Shimia ponticola TaxID=2582893 RepID=UPI0011BD8D80|nr:phage portal protein [Shimia ponticola]